MTEDDCTLVDDRKVTDTYLWKLLRDIVPPTGIPEEDLLKALQRVNKTLTSAAIVQAYDAQLIRPKWQPTEGLRWIIDTRPT